MHTDRADVVRDRSRQIAETLARHGMGYLIGVFGLESFVPFHRGLFGHPRRDEPYTRPEHIRMALEELGATFIKLGQLLSTRADLLSPEFQAQLAKLQDSAPPVPSEQIRAALEAALGQPLEEVFATFELTPLAAASIGQAHAATLFDGTEVVVKVRRPGISAQVEADLAIMQRLAAVAQARWELAAQYDLVGLAREFARSLHDELDYVREARNAERFAAQLAHDRAVHIPRVISDLSGAQVLTMERIRGLKVTDRAALAAAGIARRALAERATRILLDMIFTHGFFHADLHPGNLFVEADGRFGLIDFGMVGTIDDETREHLAGVLLAVMNEDIDGLVDELLALGFARQRVDRAGLRSDLDQLLHSYTGRPLGEIALGPLLDSVFATIRRHHLLLPPDLALLLKTLITSEGMGAQLDPEFHMGLVIAPYAERLVLRHYAPLRLARRLADAGMDAARVGVDAPRLLRRLLGEIERGGLEVGLKQESLAPLIRHIERIANRIALSIIAAAFILGLAVLMSVYHPGDNVQWLGLFFALGFIIAIALGVYLVWSMLRSGRGR